MNPEPTTSDPMTDPAPALELAGLSKTYAGERGAEPVRALRDVSMSVPRGAFFGLLGPNGAGKSTLINILAGLVIKTSGTARIWGFDIEADMRAARRAIGVVPQELSIDPFFTPWETLDMQAGLYGVPKGKRRTDEILEAVGLADKARAYARSLSGGMRRRLLVAKAMVHSPPVLVLDEPSAGVDVDLRRQLWRHVRALNALGTTVLLTTHYLEEAEQLCDTIAIINHGRVVACEATEALLGRIDAKEMTVITDSPITTLPAALIALGAEKTGANRVRLHYSPSKTSSGEILAAFQAAGLTIADLSTHETELEDIFMQLTSQPDEERA